MKIEELLRKGGQEANPNPALFAEKSIAISDAEGAELFHPNAEEISRQQAIAEICLAWLMRSPSVESRNAYARDVKHFFHFAGIDANRLDQLKRIRPIDVSAWRDHLMRRGLAPASVGRKITVLRSLFSFLQVQGYASVNPAHRDFVATPPVPRDGKTVGLSPQECRQLLDAPDRSLPVGTRDRAMLAVLAYTGCRVGELCRLRVGDYRMTSGHRVLEIRGKGGKERRVPLHPEAFERIEAWLDVGVPRTEAAAALFPPTRSARGNGRDGFQSHAMTPRSVQLLVARYVRLLGLDCAITVHSFRVTALTTARERGCDIIDLQTFAGHADPRVTLMYIRNRDRLSHSPAYALKY